MLPALLAALLHHDQLACCPDMMGITLLHAQSDMLVPAQAAVIPSQCRPLQLFMGRVFVVFPLKCCHKVLEGGFIAETLPGKNGKELQAGL